MMRSKGDDEANVTQRRAQFKLASAVFRQSMKIYKATNEGQVDVMWSLLTSVMIGGMRTLNKRGEIRCFATVFPRSIIQRGFCNKDTDDKLELREQSTVIFTFEVEFWLMLFWRYFVSISVLPLTARSVEPIHCRRHQENTNMPEVLHMIVRNECQEFKHNIPPNWWSGSTCTSQPSKKRDVHKCTWISQAPDSLSKAHIFHIVDYVIKAPFAALRLHRLL